MMTLGRLRYIESYNHRADPMNRAAAVGCADVLKKHGGELIAEVKRLREALKRIEECGDITAAGPIMLAADALAEPDLGPPDIVCRRGTIAEEEFKWEGSDGT